MSLACPKTIPGWIYCIREQDYLDNSWGRYVKLGLTTRSVAQRIREHQTGNPRREESEFDINLEMMHYAEKYLHHYFAADRIGGEWFDMDNARLVSDVVPILQTLEAEMNANVGFFRAWQKAKEVPSNGNVRTPTAAEIALHQQYVSADETYKVAEARHKIHESNLRAMIGGYDGLENVVNLIEVTGSDKFNQTMFESMLTPAQLSLCEETKTGLKGSFTMKGAGSLKSLNPTVDAKLKSAKSGITSKPSLANLGGTTYAMNQSLKDEHMLFLKTKRDLKVAEWACLRIKAELAAALGADEAITDILTWKRESTTTTQFSSKLAKELFPKEYHACLTSQKNSVRVDWHEGRKYMP